MTLYLVNAFSGSMLSAPSGVVSYETITVADACEMLHKREFVNAIGHPSTASLLSKICDMEIKPNRIMVSLKSGDQALVFQLTIRLQEGQVLSDEEIGKLFNEGKAKFMLFIVL